MLDRYVAHLAVSASVVEIVALMRSYSRRLASTLSLPVGVNNQQIKADTPRDFAGFQSATALQINIRIAHTTGEIMCCESVSDPVSVSRAQS